MPPQNSVSLEVAPPELKPELRRMLDAYLAWFDEQEGQPPSLDAQGHVRYRSFDDYWSDPMRVPFVIRRDDEVAGFCLLRDDGTCWQVAEFGVLSRWRRAGVGAAAVAALKRYCAAAGRHRCLVASTLFWNDGALAFWQAQGFVTEGQDEDSNLNVYRW